MQALNYTCGNNDFHNNISSSCCNSSFQFSHLQRWILLSPSHHFCINPIVTFDFICLLNYVPSTRSLTEIYLFIIIIIIIFIFIFSVVWGCYVVARSLYLFFHVLSSFLLTKRLVFQISITFMLWEKPFNQIIVMWGRFVV